MATTPKTPTAQVPSKRFCGKKGRSGPPKGNRNAMRHGLRMGRLPKELQYYDQRMDDFRRQIEDLVFAATGQVAGKSAVHIVAAGYRYRAALLSARKLRQLYDEGKEGSAEWFDHIDRQAANMDKVADRVAKLPLDRDAKQNIVDALYSRVIPAPNGHSDQDNSNGQAHNQ